jgi:hypothetical protein
LFQFSEDTGVVFLAGGRVRGLCSESVIHTDCFFDVSAMHLDDPSTLVREAHRLGVVPVEMRKV